MEPWRGHPPGSAADYDSILLAARSDQTAQRMYPPAPPNDARPMPGRMACLSTGRGAQAGEEFPVGAGA